VTAGGTDNDRDPATPTLARADVRASVGEAEPPSSSGADTARGWAGLGARGWRARWPLLLVIGWAALAVTDLLLFGVGTASPFAADALPGAASHATAPAAASQPAPMGVPRVLSPASAVAFGPAGIQSGDDPAGASLAIDASTATAWHSNSYPGAAFGSGTGLLIDMGQPVTITAVRLVLGSTPGADLQLLTSNDADLSQLRLQASASDAGGTLTLTTTAPQRARYLLIWFTLLPPDPSGTYQASVYDVRIEGTP